MPISFKVGQHYRNRDGKFEVVSLQGESMTIRYADGRKIITNVTLQSRIQERIQEERSFSAGDALVQDANDSDETGLKTDEIRDFVAEILRGLRQPWTADITDKVCLNIESRRDRLSHYQKLAKDFGQPTVNISIGLYVKQLTGMESTGQTATPKSGLISSYSVLVPGKASSKARGKSTSRPNGKPNSKPNSKPTRKSNESTS